MRIPINATITIMVSVAAFSVVPLAAQQIWTAPDANRTLGLRLIHIFSRDDQFGALSSFVFDADGETPIGRNLGLEVDLPFSDFSFHGTSDNHVGNPYVGLHVAPRGNLSFRFGVRPGLIAQDEEGAAALGAAYADFDHLEAWSGKRTSIRGLMEFGDVAQRRGGVTGYAGATYISGYSIDGFGPTAEILLDYGIRFGYQDAAVNAGLALTGRYLAHPDDGGFDSRDNNQVALTVEGARGSVRPTFSIGTFLDDAIRQSGLRAIASIGLRLVGH